MFSQLPNAARLQTFVLTFGLGFVPCMLSGCGTKPVPPATTPSQTSQPPAATTPTASPPPAKASAVPGTPTVAENTGTVKFDIDSEVDPKVIVSIDGNDYTLNEVGEPVPLKSGEHQLDVKQGDRVIETRKFTVVQGKRQILRVRDPDRAAAERVLELGGVVRVLVDRMETEVKATSALPEKPFRITHIFVDGKSQAGDADFEYLHGLTAIKNLHLADTSITDRTMEQIKGLTGLSDLNLRGTHVTDAGLGYIKDLKIGVLTLTGTKVTDAGLVYLKDLRNLYHLNLSETAVTDSGLEHLSGLSNLTSLFLDGTKVSDAGLVHVKDLQKLIVFGLRGTQVSDAGLVHVKGLSKLNNLYLNDTKVTDAGVSELKGALPNCKISQ